MNTDMNTDMDIDMDIYNALCTLRRITLSRPKIQEPSYKTYEVKNIKYNNQLKCYVQPLSTTDTKTGGAMIEIF